jgi:acetolactate decarboxylase
MKMAIQSVLIFVVFLHCYTGTSFANTFNIKSYGHFKKMMHMKKTEGVVEIQEAIPSVNCYAVGAIQKGLGEITVLNNEIWLNYGKDGIGHSVNSIPAGEKAVLLATSQVEKWQEISVEGTLSKEQLFTFILDKSKQQGLDINAPFPFMLEGCFDNLLLHVVNGVNPKFGGHGKKSLLFRQLKEERNKQKAIVIGFYSASTQGVYTHPGTSWHMHVVIPDENIGAHVDGISILDGSILKLPNVPTN